MDSTGSPVVISRPGSPAAAAASRPASAADFAPSAESAKRRVSSPVSALTRHMDLLDPLSALSPSARHTAAYRELADIPALSAEKWSDWDWTFRNALDAGGTGNYFFKKFVDSRGVTRRRRRTDCESKEAKAAWDTNASLTCTWMRRAVGREHFSIIKRYVETDDPQSAYDALVAKFEFHTSGTRMGIVNELTTFLRSSGEDYEEVFKRCDVLMDQHKRHTPTHFGQDELRDEMGVAAIIRTIDNSFSIHSNLINNDGLTYSECKDIIRKHEANAKNNGGRRLQDGPANVSSVLLAMESAHVAAGTDRACFFCTTVGHTVFRCEKFQRFQELVKTGKINIDRLLNGTNSSSQATATAPSLTTSLAQTNSPANGNHGKGKKKKKSGGSSANAASEFDGYEYAGKTPEHPLA